LQEEYDKFVKGILDIDDKIYPEDIQQQYMEKLKKGLRYENKVYYDDLEI